MSLGWGVKLHGATNLLADIVVRAEEMESEDVLEKVEAALVEQLEETRAALTRVRETEYDDQYGQELD